MPSMDLECTDYHQKYKNLKRKLKALIYENECFQDELKKAQKKLLKVSRDKSFLLDRLLAYETVESSSSDSEATLLSDSDTELKADAYNCKKRKLPSVVENQEGSIASSSNTNSAESKKKKSRKVCPVKVSGQQNLNHVILEPVLINHRDGHLTSEEIERHLEAKQPFQDLMPEKAPLTVPAEMFSDESSGIEKLVLVSQI